MYKTQKHARHAKLLKCILLQEDTLPRLGLTDALLHTAQVDSKSLPTFEKSPLARRIPDKEIIIIETIFLKQNLEPPGLGFTPKFIIRSNDRFLELIRRALSGNSEGSKLLLKLDLSRLTFISTVFKRNPFSE